KLTMNIKSKIAFTKGHGELDSLQVADISKEMSDYYTVKQIKLEGKLSNIKNIQKYKVIIIAKPDSVFSEQNKFIIDQYIMNGGKVLWFIDGAFASMDSLTTSPVTYGITLPLNLEDQFFKYGVRINNNLIMDIRSGAVPVPVNNKYTLRPWFYFPLIAQSNNHPIVNNINLVKCEFASTIDTITNGIKKTSLLSTSRYTSVLNVPARIDMRTIFQEPDEKQFHNSYKTVAILLEGEFESLYKNRMPPEIDSIPEIKFKEKSQPTKMIIVSDGDVIKNFVQHSTGRAYPLGFDIYTGQTYGNKNFILNAINYLCDDSGLLQVRSREIKLRMLDKQKTEKEKTKCQMMNTALPVLLVIIFGIAQTFIRRKKYAK
ncbi:MAG: gliding motility-associated ABC transporter substrate-binding protein GldG, partial [Bacteroidota bacterium]